VQVQERCQDVTEKDGRFTLLDDGPPFSSRKIMRAFRQDDARGQEFVELVLELRPEIQGFGSVSADL
jgi:hypothetical protein